MNVTFPAVTTSISSQINKKPNTQPPPAAFQSADRLTLSKPTPKFAGQAEDEKLSEAARSGDTAQIRKLLKQGANIEAKNIENRTPLHRAAKNGHLETIQTLVQLGANIEAKDMYGQTPLHLVTVCRMPRPSYLDINFQPIGILRPSNSDVGFQARLNELRISRSTKGTKESIQLQTIRTLTELGADLKATDHSGQTPLDLAKAHQQKEAQDLLETLLEQQKKQPAQPTESRSTLNPKQQEQSKPTLKSILKEQSKPTLKPILKEQSKPTLKPILKEQSKPTLKPILKEQSKPTLKPILKEQSGLMPKPPLEKQSRPTLNPRQQEQWNRMLHSAIETESIETIEGIVQIGADINAPGLDGQTPLQRAKERRHRGMVDLLRKLGAQEEPVMHLPFRSDHTQSSMISTIRPSDSASQSGSEWRSGTRSDQDSAGAKPLLNRTFDALSYFNPLANTGKSPASQVSQSEASTSSQTRYSELPEEDALPTRGPGSYTPSISTRSASSTGSEQTSLPFRFSRKPVGSSAGSSSASSQTRYSVIPEEDALPTRGPGSYAPSISTRSTASTDSQETIRRFSRR